MIVTSPNHEGVDGMDCEEVWMWIAESAILLMCPPYQGDSQCLPDRKAHSSALYLSPMMISLRNSWAQQEDAMQRSKDARLEGRNQQCEAAVRRLLTRLEGLRNGSGDRDAR